MRQINEQCIESSSAAPATTFEYFISSSSSSRSLTRSLRSKLQVFARKYTTGAKRQNVTILNRRTAFISLYTWRTNNNKKAISFGWFFVCRVLLRIFKLEVGSFRHEYAFRVKTRCGWARQRAWQTKPASAKWIFFPFSLSTVGWRLCISSSRLISRWAKHDKRTEEGKNCLFVSIKNSKWNACWLKVNHR